jgi:uncharacterized membrane protein
MVDSLVQGIISLFSGRLPKELIVFIISMVPILELRGSILAAGFLQMNFLSTYLIAVIGNMLPIPFILMFINQIFTWLKRTKRFRPMIEKLESKAMSKSGKIQKYGKLGLFLFVAIPLPGTGAWTGSLIASLLRFKIRDSLPWIFLGVLTAGLVMSLLAFGIIKPIIS